MKSPIYLHRLHNQFLAPAEGKAAGRPAGIAELLARFGAMQAQEYFHVKWAFGLRLPHITEADMDAAFNAGEIIRTHILRPTWHFVAPADLRWMLALSAPRVHAGNAYYYRQSGLNDGILAKAFDIITKALEGGNHLTRDALNERLSAAGINQNGALLKGVPLAYIFMHAELEAMICSGPRVGNQFTYALFDERIPAKVSRPVMPKEEALAELTRRYFSTRGPATLHDFVWWSGLTMQDAKAGAAMLPKEFVRVTWEGKEYILPERAEAPAPIHLDAVTFPLPDYDEYGIAYKDRSAMAHPDNPPQKGFPNAETRYHFLLVDGRAGGTWTYNRKGKTVAVEAQPWKPWSAKEQVAVDASLVRFKQFFGG